jgi:hypothetical protein
MTEAPLRDHHFWARRLALPAIAALLAIGLWPSTALAYIGPPIALGTLGAVCGIAVTTLSTMFYLVLRAFRQVWQRVSAGTRLRSWVSSGE